MSIPKKIINAGAGALVQRVPLTFAGVTFDLPTDPMALDPTVPYPQLVVALALQLATLMQVMDDVVIATRKVDIASLRAEILALQALKPEAALSGELVIDAAEQLQEVCAIILQMRAQAVMAARAEVDAGGGEHADGG